MSRPMRYLQTWVVGEWMFYEIDGREISDTYEGRKLYGFGPVITEAGREARISRWYDSLEHAMASAIAEKYTGPESAGGTGVGTAADWFMQMIGANQLVAAPDRETQSTLQEVLHATQREDGPLFRRARAITAELERQGLVLARMNHR